MLQNTKYFTTRQWGFGSNIVNFIKSASYCLSNDCKLVLQDRYNTISQDFPLFQFIKLPENIVRNNQSITIPVFDLKSLIKFLINRDYLLSERVKYSLFFVTGIKSEFFMKNFNFDEEINQDFLININEYRSNVINKIWVYDESILSKFNEYDLKYGLSNYTPDLAIQIRGGDKIGEIQELGYKVSIVAEYLSLIVEEIKNFKNENLEVFVMTDTYDYYLEIKNEVNKIYPKVKLLTLASASNNGYQQDDFNNLDADSKKEEYFFFLYELDFLRRSMINIGSFNSNIFFLAYITSYNANSKFMSVDSSLSNTFI